MCAVSCATHLNTAAVVCPLLQRCIRFNRRMEQWKVEVQKRVHQLHPPPLFFFVYALRFAALVHRGGGPFISLYALNGIMWRCGFIHPTRDGFYCYIFDVPNTLFLLKPKQITYLQNFKRRPQLQGLKRQKRNCGCDRPHHRTTFFEVVSPSVASWHLWKFLNCLWMVV